MICNPASLELISDMRMVIVAIRLSKKEKHRVRRQLPRVKQYILLEKVAFVLTLNLIEVELDLLVVWSHETAVLEL